MLPTVRERSSKACSASAAALVACACVGFVTHAGASADSSTDRAKTPTLPLATNVARIRIDLSRRHAVVVHEINLARGAFVGEDFDYFAAFGAPGPPTAFDARIVAVPRGALEAPASGDGTSLAWSYATRRPASASALVGRSTMAGIALHVSGDALTRALATSGMATLRMRAVYPLPNAASGGDRELVVRVGEDMRGPLPLGRVEIATNEHRFLVRADARFCRGTTDGDPLAIRTLTPEGVRPRAVGSGAAIFAARSSGEDLCIRFAVAAQ